MSAQKDNTQICPILCLLKSLVARLKLGNICILYFSIPSNNVEESMPKGVLIQSRKYIHFCI